MKLDIVKRKVEGSYQIMSIEGSLKSRIFTQAISKEVSKCVGYQLNLSSDKFFLLICTDFFFTQIVINLFNTSTWRGVWNLIDIMLMYEGAIWKVGPLAYEEMEPSEDFLVTCTIAVITNMFVYIIAPFIQEMTKDLQKCYKFLCTRLFTITYFFFYILLWRSFWNLFAGYIEGYAYFVLAFVGSSLILILFGSFNSVVLGLPTSVSLDNRSDYCIVTTQLRSSALKSLKNPSWKALVMIIGDALLTIFVEVLVILVWYSLDSHNQILLPDYPYVSKLTQCLVPMALGFGFGVLALLVCFLAVWMLEGIEDSSHVQWLTKRRVSHWIVAVVGLLSSSLHWVGLWLQL